MKEIKLNKGYVAIVDDEDYDEVSQYTWYCKVDKKILYAERRTNAESRRSTILMHRFILGLRLGDKKIVDHINHDGLDNRRCNLRVCTQAQNMWNATKKDKSASSKYKGVHYKPKTNNWVAKICVHYKTIRLGVHKTEADAANAYNQAALKYHGEFAHVNTIDQEIE